MIGGRHLNVLGGLSPRQSNVPFNAANFSATGAMTWTVQVGDVTTFRYSILDGLMTIWLNLTTTTVGGVVAGNNLLVTIPEGRVPRNSVAFVVAASPGGGALESVLASFTAGVGQFTILRYAANWIAGADNTGVAACGITFEMQ